MNHETGELNGWREFLREGWSIELEAPSGSESSESILARTVKAPWLGELAERHTCRITRPIRISNAIIDGPLNLRNVIFECEVSITGCQFTSDVDFSFAVFRREVTFDKCVFHGNATFRAVHAESYFRVPRARFAAAAEFVDLCVDEVLDAESASFGTVRFDRMKVLKGALFRPFSRRKEFKGETPESEIKPVQFRGNARFWGAHIAGTVEFHAALFEGEADFECMRVDGNALFLPDGNKNCVRFCSKVRFLGARIGGTAEFDGAQFSKEASFERINIGGSAFFREDTDGNAIRFNDAVTFFGAHIHSNAEFFGAQFAKKAVFEHILVDGDAFFGPDDTDDAAQSNPAKFHGKVKFNLANFKGLANFREVQFVKDTIFDGAAINGSADFRGSVFEGPVSFRDASFRALRFRDIVIEAATLPKQQFKGFVDLRGFTYERIGVAWGELLRMSAPYDRHPYTQLERVLRSSGYDREADNVYFLRREREAKQLRAQASAALQKIGTKNLRERLAGSETWKSFLENFEIEAVRDWPRIGFDQLQRAIFHYGVRPYRLLVLSALVIIVGAYMFVQTNAVMSKNREDRKEPVQLAWSQALGVSLRLFVPIVEIPSGNEWIPTEQPAPGLSGINLSFAGYASLHRLAGAVLVPLGVAALTGLIRRREKT